MLGSDPHDDTSRDYEPFEKEPFAQDRDATSVDTADVDDTTAQRLVSDLVDAAVVTPVPDECDHVACDGCGLVVDTLAALTRFRVELGHLEGPIQLCARCSSGGLATYWTHNLEEHR